MNLDHNPQQDATAQQEPLPSEASVNMAAILLCCHLLKNNICNSINHNKKPVLCALAGGSVAFAFLKLAFPNDKNSLYINLASSISGAVFGVYARKLLSDRNNEQSQGSNPL